MTDLNNDIRELNIDELDAVSGGLKDIPDKDHFNQADVERQ